MPNDEQKSITDNLTSTALHCVYELRDKYYILVCYGSLILGHTSGISLQFRSSSLRSLSRESRDAEKPMRRRSVLMNTSYSSEEHIGNVSAGKETEQNIVQNANRA